MTIRRDERQRNEATPLPVVVPAEAETDPDADRRSGVVGGRPIIVGRRRRVVRRAGGNRDRWLVVDDAAGEAQKCCER
jgi:hypothetical protein